MRWIGDIRVGPWSSMMVSLHKKKHHWWMGPDWQLSEEPLADQKTPRRNHTCSTLDLWSWLSSLWNWEKIDSYCLALKAMMFLSQYSELPKDSVLQQMNRPKFVWLRVCSGWSLSDGLYHPFSEVQKHL